MSLDVGSFQISSSWLRSPADTYIKASVMKELDSQRWAVEPDELEEIVDTGQDMFLDAIETYHRASLLKNQGRALHVSKPAIWLAQLSVEADSRGRWNKVFADGAFDNGRSVRAIKDIKEPYRAYWRAVETGGSGLFKPAAQRLSGRALGGAWLLLELDESK